MISLADLESRFHMPLADVAKEMKVSQTYMKKVCRGHNITRWPFRKFRANERKAAKTMSNQKSYANRLRNIDHMCDETQTAVSQVLNEAVLSTVAHSNANMEEIRPSLSAPIEHSSLLNLQVSKLVAEQNRQHEWSDTLHCGATVPLHVESSDVAALLQETFVLQGQVLNPSSNRALKFHRTN